MRSRGLISALVGLFLLKRHARPVLATLFFANTATFFGVTRRLNTLSRLCATDEKAWCSYVRLSTASNLCSVYLITVCVAQLALKTPGDMCAFEAR